MDILKFLEEKGLQNEANRVLYVTSEYKQITLLQLLEDYRNEILFPKENIQQFKEGERVFLKNDPTGKRYKVCDYFKEYDTYIISHPCVAGWSHVRGDEIKAISEDEEA